MQLSVDYAPCAGYLAELADEDPAKLDELAEQVNSLVEHPGWAVLNSLIGIGERQTMRQLTDGSTLEGLDAARLGGFLAGMWQARTAAASVQDYAAGSQARRSQEAAREAAGQAAEVGPDGLSEAT